MAGDGSKPMMGVTIGSGIAARAATCALTCQALGYSLGRLLEAGLIGPQGPDTFCRRVIFPAVSGSTSLICMAAALAIPSPSPPASKGGLFASVRQFGDVILLGDAGLADVDAEL